eukprot:Sspe_Gene.52873::Locus_29273_Transcript_1_1_Confidence_1.000_Length_2448::g.52873::m.52873
MSKARCDGQIGIVVRRLGWDLAKGKDASAVPPVTALVALLCLLKACGDTPSSEIKARCGCLRLGGVEAACRAAAGLLPSLAAAGVVQRLAVWMQTTQRASPDFSSATAAWFGCHIMPFVAGGDVMKWVGETIASPLCIPSAMDPTAHTLVTATTSFSIAWSYFTAAGEETFHAPTGDVSCTMLRTGCVARFATFKGAKAACLPLAGGLEALFVLPGADPPLAEGNAVEWMESDGRWVPAIISAVDRSAFPISVTYSITRGGEVVGEVPQSRVRRPGTSDGSPLDSLVEVLSRDWEGFIEQLTPALGDVWLPRFSLAMSASLKDLSPELATLDVFSYDKASLNGLFAEGATAGYISDAVLCSAVCVDERGISPGKGTQPTASSPPPSLDFQIGEEVLVTSRGGGKQRGTLKSIDTRETPTKYVVSIEGSTVAIANPALIERPPGARHVVKYNRPFLFLLHHAPTSTLSLVAKVATPRPSMVSLDDLLSSSAPSSLAQQQPTSSSPDFLSSLFGGQPDPRGPEDGTRTPPSAFSFITAPSTTKGPTLDLDRLFASTEDAPPPPAPAPTVDDFFSPPTPLPPASTEHHPHTVEPEAPETTEAVPHADPHADGVADKEDVKRSNSAEEPFSAAPQQHHDAPHERTEEHDATDERTEAPTQPPDSNPDDTEGNLSPEDLEKENAKLAKHLIFLEQALRPLRDDVAALKHRVHCSTSGPPPVEPAPPSGEGREGLVAENRYLKACIARRKDEEAALRAERTELQGAVKAKGKRTVQKVQKAPPKVQKKQ